MGKGIFSRAADIIKVNLNELLDQAEEAEKMVGQIILEMEEAVNKATASVGTAVANEKRLERQYLNQQDQVKVWQRKAEQSIQAGHDELARRALQRKALAMETLGHLEVALEESRKTADQLKQQLLQLKTKLAEAHSRQGALIARQRAARLRKQIAQSMTGVGTDAFSSFERFRQRVESEEAEADAHEELADASQPSLEEAFAKLKRKEAVEDELQVLKKKLGQGQGQAASENKTTG